MYTYKQLAGPDITTFKQLLGVFAEAFEDMDTYRGAVPSDEYLAKFLKRGDTVVLVAQDGETVVGGLVAYVLQKFERERSEVYIYDLAVALPHRRKGIATQLLRVLKREAKKLGAYVIYVQADALDEPAIKLYESLGAREEVGSPGTELEFAL